VKGLRPGRGKGKEKEIVEKRERVRGKSEMEVAELWKEVKLLRRVVMEMRKEIGEGFKKNRWEIRGLRDLLDGDWEEGSELESAEEVMDRMEVDKELVVFESPVTKLEKDRQLDRTATEKTGKFKD
jgi:hypothetical protein